MTTRLRKATIAFLVLVGMGLWTIQPVLAAEPALTALTLTPGVVTLNSDQTTAFTLTGTYSNATTANVTELATWTPNGGGFTGIPGQKGSFTVNAVGTWTVTATVGGLTASAAVTITHGSPIALTLMPTPASVTTDESVSLRLFAADADGNGWDVTSVAAWSKTEATGSIGATGYQPQTVGSWAMHASLGALQVSRAITVTAGIVKTLNITPATTQTLTVGTSAQLQATAYDADGNLLAPVISWAVSNPEIGSVSADGTFTALAPGQTNIMASAGGIQSIIPIIVHSASVVGTEADPEIIAVARPTPTTRTPRVAAAEIEKQPEVAAKITTPITTGLAVMKKDSNIPHPWIIVLTLVHVILLAGYFTWLMKRSNSWWWVPPVVSTGVLLAVYSLAVEKGTYLWWPWTIIGLTIIFISVYYQRYGPQEASPGSMTSPPGSPPQ